MLSPIVEADGSLLISNVLGKKVHQSETEAGSLIHNGDLSFERGLFA